MNDISPGLTRRAHEATVSQMAKGACCRSCGAHLDQEFLDLGMSPLVQSFVAPDKLDESEAFYPLRTLICTDCTLVQLREYVAPSSIFSEYAYFSSYSASWVAHAHAYCHAITSRLALGPTSLVVEIASNDGYLLQHFLPLGIPVLGIEPAANVAKEAEKKGIPVVVEFFGEDLARKVVSERGKADLIVGNNVFAHVPDLNDFVAGLKGLLGDDGVITLEFPHLERLVSENQFDTIYHEHFSYFSLLTAARTLARHQLEVFDVEELQTHGGSLRIFVKHVSSTAHAVSPRVQALAARELQVGLDDMTYLGKFREKVHATKRNLLATLIDLKDSGKTIVGYGAPGKGNTLLNYCGIGTDFLDYTVDRNPYKHGQYTPGMHVPVLPVEAIDETRPDYILLLPWNLKTEIISQMRHVGGWGCKFIVPIPSVEIIDPNHINF